MSRNPWEVPEWRNPKSKLEGDSLILDIQTYLKNADEESIYRELAIQKAFTIASWHSISREHRSSIMDIISLYGEEAIRPILYAVGDKSITAVIDLACSFISQFNLPLKQEKEELAKSIEDKFTKLTQDAIKENNDVGRSVLSWDDHELVYLHSGGIKTKIEEDVKPNVGNKKIELPRIKDPVALNLPSNLSIKGPFPGHLATNQELVAPKISSLTYILCAIFAVISGWVSFLIYGLL